MTVIQRLEDELRTMTQLAGDDPRFYFRASGLPPSAYYCSWQVPGLERLASGAVERRNAHQFAIVLGSDFPFEPPSILWQTPIFHPNFQGERVCLGTIWYGGLTIADLCVSLRRLVMLEDFNVFDPLDRAAAAWLRDRIRTDRRFVPLSAES